MIVRYTPTISYQASHQHHLTPGKQYLVISIEADYYRILNDENEPYFYPPEQFEIIDSTEPVDWITEYDEEKERYSSPPELATPGFFEDYFDGDPGVIVKFEDCLQKTLMKFNGINL